MRGIFGMGSAYALAGALMASQGADHLSRDYGVEVVPRGRSKRAKPYQPPAHDDQAAWDKAEAKRQRKAAKLRALAK